MQPSSGRYSPTSPRSPTSPKGILKKSDSSPFHVRPNYGTGKRVITHTSKQVHQFCQLSPYEWDNICIWFAAGICKDDYCNKLHVVFPNNEFLSRRKYVCYVNDKNFGSSSNGLVCVDYLIGCCDCKGTSPGHLRHIYREEILNRQVVSAWLSSWHIVEAPIMLCPKFMGAKLYSLYNKQPSPITCTDANCPFIHWDFPEKCNP